MLLLAWPQVTVEAVSVNQCASPQRSCLIAYLSILPCFGSVALLASQIVVQHDCVALMSARSRLLILTKHRRTQETWPRCIRLESIAHGSSSQLHMLPRSAVLSSGRNIEVKETARLGTTLRLLILSHSLATTQRRLDLSR
jgi:hypothetical protein